MGVTVPIQRAVARAFATLPLTDCRRLLASPVHEHRLTAVLILIRQFQKGDEAHRARIYRLLLGARRALDNWDLVDTAAPRIFGAYLLDHPEERTRFEGFLRSPSISRSPSSFCSTRAGAAAGHTARTPKPTWWLT